MKFNSKSVIAVMLLSASLISCNKKDDDDKKLNVSSTYDGTTFNSHPVKEGIDALIEVETTLPNNRPGAAGGVKEITSASLISDLSVGNPSALDMASTEFKNNLKNVLFPEYQKNSKATADGAVIDWSDLSATPNGGGDIYIFNSDAVEIEQIIIKGGFAGVGFNYAKNVLFSDLENVTLAQLDAALNLYGSNPTFENVFQTAKYSTQRSKGNNTYHELIQLEFRTAQSAIKQGFNAEKVAAINNILLLWEESLAAQIILYSFDVIDYFTKTTITDEDRSKSCHAWGEAVGMLHGFYKVTGKKITDAQIESVLENLNATTNGLGKPAEIEGDLTKLANVTAAIDELAAIYGLNKNDHKRN